jgi:hypothetical protein
MSILINVYWFFIKSKTDKYLMIISKVTEHIKNAEYFENKISKLI